MRPASRDYLQLLASPILRPCWEVTSWLGAQCLGTVEVKSATVTETSAEQVTGKLELTAANTKQWRPSSPTSPLGWYGQQLQVRTGLRNASGQPVVWFNLGRFRVRKPDPSGEVLQVRADSLQQLVVNARFTTPTVFAASTYKDRVRSLLKGILPVLFNPALVDRSVKAQTYERERADALADTLAAWPAVIEMQPSGVAYVTTPWESRTVVTKATYTDGPGGTVVDVDPETGGEDDVPNAVVALSEPDDGKVALSEVAYVSNGPMRWGGPYGYLPEFYSSPLLTTRAQLRAAATTRLATLRRPVQQVRVTMVCDGRLQLGDVIRVKSAQRDTNVLGRVTVVPHGLTPAERVGEHVLAVISGTVDGQVVDA